MVLRDIAERQQTMEENQKLLEGPCGSRKGFSASSTQALVLWLGAQIRQEVSQSHTEMDVSERVMNI